MRGRLALRAGGRSLAVKARVVINVIDNYMLHSETARIVSRWRRDIAGPHRTKHIPRHASKSASLNLNDDWLCRILFASFCDAALTH